MKNKKERMSLPIIFSGGMVQAILDKRKSQTRRLDLGRFKKGDILWVRESFKVGAWDDDNLKVAIDYLASPKLTNTPWKYPVNVKDRELIEKWIRQSLDDLTKSQLTPDESGNYHWQAGKAPTRNRPSVFMPKFVARIWLEVTDVRREKLKDISEADCFKEGVVLIPDIKRYTVLMNGQQVAYSWATAQDCYFALFRSLNTSLSISAEPEVDVIDFKVVDGEYKTEPTSQQSELL